MKRINRQTIVHTTQHRKLKNKQHEPHQKLGVISGALEGKADPAPHRVALEITNPVDYTYEREGDCSYDVRNISDIICETVIP